ncbi:helix-turn-helix domain-containing protein [Streptodolium elevatio]|uniref:Helix-turn-helix domain-containing protein n=1 Tax=Streptodolium elevatio TaxID=3157996 RepID=A0ABV3DCR8_9ACTN
MRSTASAHDDSATWEVARPPRPSRLAGVDMAGFHVPHAPVDGLRMIPHPAVTLIVEFGAGGYVLDDGSGRRHRGSAVAGPGLGLGGNVRAWGEDVACVQVRLSPVVACTLLGISPAELTGATVLPLDDLWGREASRIRERLSECTSWAERFALTEMLLARRAAARTWVDPEVAWSWRRINAEAGLVRVEDLACELGWSRKRLWSRFNAQIGMPPKRAAKLVRFDRAAHRLVAGESAARVAADGGYFDQSHLHRDVVTFTGATPAAVVEEPFLTVDDVAWPAAARATPRHSPGRTRPVS